MVVSRCVAFLIDSMLNRSDGSCLLLAPTDCQLSRNSPDLIMSSHVCVVFNTRFSWQSPLE
jgi:hypothetical protein